MPPLAVDFETDDCPVHRDDRPIACAPVRLEAGGCGPPLSAIPPAVALADESWVPSEQTTSTYKNTVWFSRAT